MLENLEQVSSNHDLMVYVRDKFAQRQAAGIYYIPFKKLLPKILTQVRQPKMAKNYTAHKANWPKLPKNELQTNIWYFIQVCNSDWHLIRMDGMSRFNEEIPAEIRNHRAYDVDEEFYDLYPTFIIFPLFPTMSHGIVEKM